MNKPKPPPVPPVKPSSTNPTWNLPQVSFFFNIKEFIKFSELIWKQLVKSFIYSSCILGSCSTKGSSQTASEVQMIGSRVTFSESLRASEEALWVIINASTRNTAVIIQNFLCTLAGRNRMGFRIIGKYPMKKRTFCALCDALLFSWMSYLT